MSANTSFPRSASKSQTHMQSVVSRKLCAGEEMRLLSIGVALVGAPASLLVDRPAIGLDLPAAARIMRRLQSIAATGTTVVAACAPLSAGAYSALDGVVALQGGRVAYAGPTGPLAPRPVSDSHVASRGACQIGIHRTDRKRHPIGRSNWVLPV